MRAVAVGIVVIAMLAAGCSSGASDENGIDTASSVADLAERLGVEESSVTVVSAEPVTWPDGSLGCPEPDMMYTQALADGTLIILEVDGVTYEYHSGADSDPFYCENPTPPVSSS